MARTLTLDGRRGRRHPRPRTRDLPARVLRRAARRRGRRRRDGAAAEHDRGRPSPALSRASRRLPAGRAGRHRRRSRAARVLPLAPGSSGAAVAVRSRPRVAVVLLRHRLGDGRRARRPALVDAEGGPVSIRGRISCVTSSLVNPKPVTRNDDDQDQYPHAPSSLHRQAGRRRSRRRHGRRAARPAHVEARGAEEAPLQRRREAPQLRQHLPERRGHPLPRSGGDRGEAGRHAQHHPVGRRRCRHGRGAAGVAQLRRDQALQPSPDPSGSGDGRAEEAEGRARALHRRRRPGLARGDVSGRGRRRHDRHRRLRRRRLQQPAAPDSARHARRGAPEAAVGVRPPAGAQPAT